MVRINQNLIMNELFHKWIGTFGVSFTIDSDGVYHWENWENKTVPTQEEIESKKNELDLEWEKLKYQRDRAEAYDPIPEQLAQIYHDMDGWKAKIKSIKVKYPKP